MSSTTVNPYLIFDGNAREAMEFYASVLGGELEQQTYAEAGMGDQPNAADLIHAQLTSGEMVIMASDTNEGIEVEFGNNLHISIVGDDGDQLRAFFAGLSAGGEVTMPLEKQFWGDEFGMLTDRFGVRWMVNISAPADQ